MSTSSIGEVVRVVNETLVNFSCKLQDVVLGKTEKQTKRNITMKSLILAQDER